MKACVPMLLEPGHYIGPCPSNAAINAHWRLNISLDFNPSSSNFCEVQFIDGTKGQYLLQLSGNSSDALSLLLRRPGRLLHPLVDGHVLPTAKKGIIPFVLAPQSWGEGYLHSGIYWVQCRIEGPSGTQKNILPLSIYNP